MSGTRDTGHVAPLRGLDHVDSSSTRAGRFGRLFRHLPPAHDLGEDRETLTRLGQAMVARTNAQEGFSAEENKTISAGYTYLGQFIDHDLTFDPATSLIRADDPDARTNFRTPRFDLDSVYGRGPLDQPYMYETGGKRFLLGRMLHDHGVDPPQYAFDLPRNANDRAIIGDPRNDENKIVSQLHSLFLELHNSFVDKGRSFNEAQRLTRWHFQWIVLKDYLPAITGDTITSWLSEIEWRHGKKSQGKRSSGNFLLYKPEKSAFIPVEFSAAAFRFGHSMVRPTYRFTHTEEQPLPILAVRGTPSLRGREAIPIDWAIDWDFFFSGKKPELVQSSFRIDTKISEPLSRLKEAGAVEEEPENLAVRNLLRGAQLGLPSGEAVCHFLGVEPISWSDLYNANGQVRAVGLEEKGREALRDRTPLWFYILREAEILSEGRHLGPIGSRIVGEVITGLLLYDKFSYLNLHPSWAPSSRTYRMQELVREVVEYRHNRLRN